MISAIDDLHRQIQLTYPAHRIVSLVPSITKTLIDLGLQDRLVGVTKFCDDPIEITKQIQKIGGTKNPNIEFIYSLQPDLILANKEENREEDILYLQQFFQVYISDTKTIDDALRTISHLGILTSIDTKFLIEKIIEKQSTLLDLKTFCKAKKVAYLIWKNPYMVAASDTFIHHMLETLGFQNVFQQSSRYPIVELNELLALDIDFIFLSSEPYPFKPLEIEIFKPNRALLVDGKAFSWYGSQLLESFSYFHALIQELKK